MRLRLLVRRNGVPDTKLVWPCSPSDDLTIAKLLTEVNDVIPLESVEWGLEDYSVELGDGTNSGSSFECLHFQIVSQILKDEDQVFIRPLMDGDLKRRRISGRHQISSDGKHLVDGIAFGRPRLRTPRDRPMLEIPPRKRARLITGVDDDGEEEEDEDYEEDEDDFEYGSDGEGDMLQLENGTASDSDHGSEDDDEDQDEDFDMDEDFQLLRKDNGADSGADTSNAAQRASTIRGLLPTLDSVAALGKAYPLLSTKTIEQALERNQNDIGETYRTLLRSNHATFSFDEMMDKAVTGILDDSGASDQEEQDHAQAAAPTRPLIQEVDVDDEVQPRIQELDSESDTTSSGSSDSESDEDSDESSDEDFEAESSASEASETLQDVQVSVFNAMDLDDESDRSEFESDLGGMSRRVNELLSDDSSSEDDSSDDSSDKSSDDSSDDSDDSDDSDAPSIQGVRNGVLSNGIIEVVNQTEAPSEVPEVPPGEGLTKTQKRNARRRKAKQAKADQIDTDTAEVLESLAARKAALLSTIDTEPETTPVATEPQVATESSAVPEKTSESTPTEEAKSTESGPRRMRMDVGAGRRLLFGALGLKAPKTKADEESLRKDMMKNVRPLQNKRLVEEVVEEQPEEEVDDESWREKITYRAIECCQEGIELSEPPFPFVQRWDPQQQYSSVRKRKRKSQQFDDSYYDTSQDMQPTEDTPVKKARTFDDQPTVDELNYDDVVPGDVDADEDLPALPENVNALPSLSKDNVKPGMVVTWKQLSMSKATNWQPQMVDQTAMIVESSTDDNIRVVLAKRDREYDDKEYDEDTGERIYDKFEVPDFEEDDNANGEDDDGSRLLAWSELTDAKVLQAEAPASFARLVSKQSEVEVSEMMTSTGGQGEAVETMRGEEQEQDSHPIESAQHMPRLGSLSADDALNSMTTDSWTSKANAGGTTTDEVVGDAVTNDQDGEQVIADSNPMVPIGHVPEFEAGVESILASTPGAESDEALEDGEASLDDDDMVIPESNPALAESISGHSLRDRSPSTSPFPSIEEMYKTASQTKSQKATQTKATKPRAAKARPTKKNAEYEDAMHRLDNGDESDEGPELFPYATQPANKPPAPEELPHPRSTPDRKAKRKANEAFAVPESSQVVDLLSSPAAASQSEGGPGSASTRRGKKKQLGSTATLTGQGPAKTRRTTSYQMLQTGGGVGRSLRRSSMNK